MSNRKSNYFRLTGETNTLFIELLRDNQKIFEIDISILDIDKVVEMTMNK